MEQPRTGTDPRWLIVGHGSVGAFLADRLGRTSANVSVLDPNPRLPIKAAEAVAALAPGTFAYAVSCVPPQAAEEVAPVAAAALAESGILFDWNTIAPADKRRIAAAASVTTVDVALLDTLDSARAHPTLAVSGLAAERGAEVLRGLEFAVSVAGDEVGDAAALKYLRSIFMKTLEAMTLEFASLASDLDHSGIVRESIEQNLGREFSEFMDLLIATNRVHAERRGAELADAVSTFVSDGARLELAEAAVGVLRHAADAWASTNAPPPDAELEVLTEHLRRTLWTEPAST
jgi:3-hydroxyisobutyrate dehydrogenase-like beta-hydroxyacid dehydrogenase